MTKIEFFPLDITYKIFNNKPVIYLFGRAVDGQQVCVIDESFEPYFWAVVDDETVVKVIEKFSAETKQGTAKVTRTEMNAKNYLGKDVKALKVFVQLPWQVPVIAKELRAIGGIVSVHEFDIPFVRRYLRDKNVTPMTLTEAKGLIVNQGLKVITLNAESVTHLSNETGDFRILAFDIETYNPHGKAVMPEQHPIVMISLYGKDLKKVLTWKRFKTQNDSVEFLDSEVEMLERFKDFITQYRPDILVGYYSDGFDFPYIAVRAEKYKINLDLGLDGSQIKLKKGRRSSVTVTGLVHLDICRFIQRAFSQVLDTDTFSLDDVSSELLGEKKHDVDMDTLAGAWDSVSDELDKFAAYNLQDSKLTYDLCIKLMPNLEEFVKLVGLTLYDINGAGFSRMVEWYIMKQASDYNEIAPNNPSYAETRERMDSRFKGAFVFQPQPGLYKDIVVYDFRSLYPSIIVSHNLGPETVKCECCEGNYVPLEGANLWFCKNKRGFIPSILEGLITRRLRVKEMMKSADPAKAVLLNARSNALKLLSNSFYGYLGFYGARWYSAEAARSTTAYARYYIKDVIAKAQAAGFKVIYSDTDSVFLTLGDKTKDDSKAFAREINEHLPELMELEFEGYFPSGIFVSAKLSDYGAKKKYALMDDKGVMKIRGFEAIRRNWSNIAKQVQQRVLDIILKEDDTAKAFNYVKNIISELRQKTIDVDDVVISTQLQRDIDDYESIGPHVAAAKRMRDKGVEVGPGTFVRFVVTAGKGIVRDRVKLPEEISDNEYDSDYYINNQVVPAVDRIFAVLGYDIKKLLEDKDQSKLSKFF
ncbi:DNA-directed DNA polymerase [Candidatus Woesearchaeota archaeon]|nr:DNA-directed DNA polymerase [Candidatus Woesearchaeota archaeon]